MKRPSIHLNSGRLISMLIVLSNGRREGKGTASFFLTLLEVLKSFESLSKLVARIDPFSACCVGFVILQWKQIKIILKQSFGLLVLIDVWLHVLCLVGCEWLKKWNGERWFMIFYFFLLWTWIKYKKTNNIFSQIQLWLFKHIPLFMSIVFWKKFSE